MPKPRQTPDGLPIIELEVVNRYVGRISEDHTRFVDDELDLISRENPDFYVIIKGVIDGMESQKRIDEFKFGTALTYKSLREQSKYDEEQNAA